MVNYDFCSEKWRLPSTHSIIKVVASDIEVEQEHLGLRLTQKLLKHNTKDKKIKLLRPFRNAAIDSASVTLETSGSRVTLHGTFRSWAEK